MQSQAEVGAATEAGVAEGAEVGAEAGGETAAAGAEAEEAEVAPAEEVAWGAPSVALPTGLARLVGRPCAADSIRRAGLGCVIHASSLLRQSATVKYG